MLKHTILLTLISLIKSQCPADEPSCLFQIPATASGGSNLWSTTSCTSYATWINLVYESVGSSNVITRMKLGTSEKAEYTLSTPNFNSDSHSKNITLSSPMVKKVGASYITIGADTFIR